MEPQINFTLKKSEDKKNGTEVHSVPPTATSKLRDLGLFDHSGLVAAGQEWPESVMP